MFFFYLIFEILFQFFHVLKLFSFGLKVLDLEVAKHFEGAVSQLRLSPIDRDLPQIELALGHISASLHVGRTVR